MNKRFALVLTLLTIGALVSGAIWHSTNTLAQDQSGASGDSGDAGKMMDDLIDEKAQKAKSNDELAVRALADEFFNSPYFAVAPADIKDALKERALREAMKNRRGKTGFK